MTDFDYTKDDFVCALRQSGLSEGDLVLTYTSMFQLGKLKDGDSSNEISKKVLDSFLEVLGSTGTLLVPTYTYSFCKNEDFDVKKTPSTLGKFPEYFRQSKDSIRSADPIFSVAGVGPKAEKILKNLPKTCFGKDSVYDRITQNNGKICMIGLGLSWATYRHFIEQKMKIPARYSKSFTGTIIENETRRNETWEYFVRHLNDNCFPDSTIIEKRFQVREMESICKKTKIGRGYILSINCKDYLKFLEEKLNDDKWFSVRGPPLS